MIAVLYQRAFHHLSEAVRTAEEEAQPSLRGQGPVASLTDAYMTLADFCDQQLRKEEESASGELQMEKPFSLSHCASQSFKTSLGTLGFLFAYFSFILLFSHLKIFLRVCVHA